MGRGEETGFQVEQRNCGRNVPIERGLDVLGSGGNGRSAPLVAGALETVRGQTSGERQCLASCIVGCLPNDVVVLDTSFLHLMCQWDILEGHSRNKKPHKLLKKLVPQEGIEPPTPSLRMTCSTD